MCTHLNLLNLPILSSSSLTSDILFKSITSREQKRNTCNYLGNYTRSRWWNSLSHFIESSTRWQHQMEASVCYSLSEMCLIGITPSSPAFRFVGLWQSSLGKSVLLSCNFWELYYSFRQEFHFTFVCCDSLEMYNIELFSSYLFISVTF
jgi:hypothetical protein